MQLTSSAFVDGATIPRRYTCDGENISPPLAWTTPPKGTKSFALLCEDPDAPRGMWRHWTVFDIPADARALPEAYARTDRPNGPFQGRNDSHRTGYDGPCPPHGHGPHRYRFRLVALSSEHLSLQKNPSCEDVTRKAQEFAIAEAVLVGRYER